MRPRRPRGVSCLPRVMPFILVSGKSTSQRYKFSSLSLPNTLSPFSYSIYSTFFFLLRTTALFSVLQFASNLWFGWGGRGGEFLYLTRWVLYCDLVHWRVLRFSCLCCFILGFPSTADRQKSTHLVKVMKENSIKYQIVN